MNAMSKDVRNYPCFSCLALGPVPGRRRSSLAENVRGQVRGTSSMRAPQNFSIEMQI